MTIPSLSPTATAASLAGTQHAAMTARAASGSSNSSAAQNRVEKSGLVAAGNPAGDSAADGGQTFDTFQGRCGGDADNASDPVNDRDKDGGPRSGPSPAIADHRVSAPHLDLQA